MTANNGQSSKIAIDFIDPLFAVVISISFTQVMLVKPSWLDSPGVLITEANERFILLTLLIGYVTIVLSWVGYHKSIRSKPIKIDTTPGFFRFIFDIVLLAGYWLLLVKFEVFGHVLVMLMLIHWTFVIWDQLKWWEYNAEDNEKIDKAKSEADKRKAKEGKRRSQRRRGISTFWAIVFTVLWLVYWILGFHDGSLDLYDWAFLVAASIFTGLYRLHKRWQRPGRLLDLLAFQLPEKETST